MKVGKFLHRFMGAIMGSCITLTLVFLYLYQLSGAFITPPIQVSSQLDDEIDMITEELYQDCDIVYTLEERQFTDTDYLEYNIQVIVVQDTFGNIPDTSIIRSAIDTINSALNLRNMSVVIKSMVELTFPYIGSGMSYKGLLLHANTSKDYDERCIKLVFIPEDVILNEELNDRLVRTKKISGAALEIPSQAFFIRDGESSQTHVITHELGHCLGLYHIFQKPDNSSMGLTSDSGDFVCDTPKADPKMAVSASCIAFPSGDIPYTEEQLQTLVHNIMSYSTPQCLRYFSNIQYKRMKKTTQLNPFLSHTLTEMGEPIELSKENLIFGDL